MKQNYYETAKNISNQEKYNLQKEFYNNSQFREKLKDNSSLNHFFHAINHDASQPGINIKSSFLWKGNSGKFNFYLGPQTLISTATVTQATYFSSNEDLTNNFNLFLSINNVNYQNLYYTNGNVWGFFIGDSSI